MTATINITRDWRNKQPLDVKRDGLRYEYADIPVIVELTEDRGELEAADFGACTENLPGVREDRPGWAVTTDEVLFRQGEEIALTEDEKVEAIEEFHRSQRGVFDD